MTRLVSRRTMLVGAGGAALSLPLLQMHTRRARAEESGLPHRFIAFFHPNGVNPAAWFPTPGASETEFTLGSSHAALEPWRDRLIVFDGLDMKSVSVGPGEPHQRGVGTCLTGWHLQEGGMVGGDGSLSGWGNGPSVDQVIAQHIGKTTPFASLECGVRADAFIGGEVRSRIVYAGAGQPLPPQNDPRAVFDQLFGTFMLDPSALQKLRARRQSVLDAVGAQFDALKARAGSEDRDKLEAHAAMVRELETRLANEPVPGDNCTVPNTHGELGAAAADDENTMPAVAKAQLDLIVMAFACDLTRVASVQFSNGANHHRFPFLTPTSLGDGHGLSHAPNEDAAAQAEIAQRDAWYASQLAYLMQRLASIPEGEGTSMLDRTLILWVNELAQGNSHSHARMPFMLAGNVEGYFKTGRYINYGGTPHNNLLVSVCNAFGLGLTSFGDPNFCTGPLPGLAA